MTDDPQARMRETLARNTELAEQRRKQVRESLEKADPGTLKWLDSAREKFTKAKLEGLAFGTFAAHAAKDDDGR